MWWFKFKYRTYWYQCKRRFKYGNYEIVELNTLSQSKLNEKELAHIIYTHNKVVNLGLPNYQGCKIPVKTRINVEFFRENLLDYKDKVICEYLEFGAPIGFQGC